MVQSSVPSNNRKESGTLKRGTGLISVPFFFEFLAAAGGIEPMNKVVLCGSVRSIHFSSAGFHITRANFHEPSFCFSSTRRSFPRKLLTGEIGDSRGVL